jgi:hypothetical protein
MRLESEGGEESIERFVFLKHQLNVYIISEISLARSPPRLPTALQNASDRMHTFALTEDSNRVLPLLSNSPGKEKNGSILDPKKKCTIRFP